MEQLVEWETPQAGYRFVHGIVGLQVKTLQFPVPLATMTGPQEVEPKVGVRLPVTDAELNGQRALASGVAKTGNHPARHGRMCVVACSEWAMRRERQSRGSRSAMPESSTGGRSGNLAMSDRLPPMASTVLRSVESRRSLKQRVVPSAPASLAPYQRKLASSPMRCSGPSSFAPSLRAASTPSENDCHRPDASRQPRR